MIRYARNIEPHPLYARDGVNPHLHHLLTSIAASEGRYPESGEIATVILSLGRTDLFPQLGQALASEGHPDAKTLNWKRVGRAVAIDQAILNARVQDELDRSGRVRSFRHLTPFRQRTILDLPETHGRMIRGLRKDALGAVPDAKRVDISAAFNRLRSRADILHQDWNATEWADYNQERGATREGAGYLEQSPVALPTEIRTSRPRDPRRMSRKSFATGPVLYAPPPWRTRGDREGITHADLHRWLGKKQSRNVDRNKVVHRDGDDIIVTLHNTPVVRLHPDGTFTLRTGGWNTPTTRRTINSVTGLHVNSVRNKPRVGIGGEELVEGGRYDQTGQRVTQTVGTEQALRSGGTEMSDLVLADYLDEQGRHDEAKRLRDKYNLSRLPRDLKLRLSRAAQAHRYAKRVRVGYPAALFQSRRHKSGENQTGRLLRRIASGNLINDPTARSLAAAAHGGDYLALGVLHDRLDEIEHPLAGLNWRGLRQAAHDHRAAFKVFGLPGYLDPDGILFRKSNAYQQFDPAIDRIVEKGMGSNDPYFNEDEAKRIIAERPNRLARFGQPVRYKKCPRCGSASRKTQSIMYRWRCKNCGLSHGRTAYAEEGGMPWVHGGKKGYARPGRPLRYAAGPSPAARILESHLRDQGMHHAAAIVRGHYAQYADTNSDPTVTPISHMGPILSDHAAKDSPGEDGQPTPTVTVNSGTDPDNLLFSLYTYHGSPRDLDLKTVNHHTLIPRSVAPSFLKNLAREGVHNADREYRLFTRKYGSFAHYDPQLPAEFPPEENEVDWRPDHTIPEDYYSGGGEAHQYEAYRAPAGGSIVRGLFYKGGSLVPDLQKFAPTRPARRTPR